MSLDFDQTYYKSEFEGLPTKKMIKLLQIYYKVTIIVLIPKMVGENLQYITLK